MKIKKDNKLLRDFGVGVVHFEDSFYSVNKKKDFKAPELYKIAKTFGSKPFLVDIRALYIGGTWSRTLPALVEKIQRVHNCDLKYPILLDNDGSILDGHHRVMKAMLIGQNKIKAIRLNADIEDIERL